MEKQNKVRISCSNCLYSKVLPIHESDPKSTRFIITESCEKCNSEGSSIQYFTENMTELSNCDCQKDEVCGICHKRKGFQVENGKLQKRITVALLRDLEEQTARGEISYSRMVELLNEFVSA